MYRSNRNFSEFKGVLTDEWTFENAFFDFDKVVWGQANTEFQIDKPIHDTGGDYPHDPSTPATVNIGGTTWGEYNFDSDSDWYRINLSAGETFEIGFELLGELVDTVLIVFKILCHSSKIIKNRNDYYDQITKQAHGLRF